MFKKIFIDLCNQKGVAPTVVCKQVGLSNAAFSCWTDESIPRRATLQRIADYFDVTIEYLKGEEKAPEDTSQSIPSQTITSNAILLDGQHIHLIPVFESVSAGFGVIADSNVIDYTPIYFFSPAEAENTICVKVKGDSMYPKIEDGDIIQVYKTDSVDSGSLAVVLLDGEEALVKKVVYGFDWIELHSINPMYPVMRFDKSNVLRLRVLGLVKKIIKNV